MTISLVVLGTVAVLAVIATVAVTVVLTRARESSDGQWAAHLARAEAAWVIERRELVNRVQAPQFVPRGPVSEFVIPEQEPDEISQVGTVQDMDDEQLAQYLAEEVV